MARPIFGAPPCPCHVFTTPSGNSNFANGSGLELGLRFQPDVDGYITGVRFYKQGSMGGVHTGTLWTSGGSSLASATFSETASGWQEVTFGSPVSVTAGTTYVASVTMNDGNYTATPNYFTSTITNYPLRAQQSTNGSFNTTAGAFPTTGSPNSSNYWLDVSYKAYTSSNPPSVNSVSPTSGAANANPNTTVSAVFDKILDPNTVTTSTFTVKDQSNSPVAGTVSYSSSTNTVSFVATSGLDAGQTYTATLEGGSGTSITNLDGDALASDYTWSFTISSTNACPCSLKDRANPASAVTADDAAGVELGVKFKPSTNGYITALRFYKPILSSDTTHTLTLWSSTGTSLGTATTANETDYGWQEAKLSSPIAVTQGQLYVVSYFTPDGTYVATTSATGNGLTANIANGYLTAYATGSAENAATGSGNSNGAFKNTTTGYPNSASPNAGYYWVDAVFATSSNPADPLGVRQTTPESNAYGVVRGDAVSATFNRALNSGTISGSTVRLFDANGSQVSGSASYDSNNHKVVFTPSSSLGAGTVYTAKLGASIAGTDGSTLGSEYTWTFTAGSALSSDVNQGPGGPILVVTNSSDVYGKYYAEILRTEGLNYFEVKDISTVSSGVLQGYDSVVLAEMALTQGQADMFSSWVSAGGNLVAMRPDDKLASLLGLTDQGTTRANQYMLIDTASAPGSGLVNETIQYHGTADNYALNGASAIASLYSDASTSTTNPAVTKRDVGSHGGQAIAFTFDLAKSVIATHQGNQTWGGTDRDGDTVRRTNDLFFGNKSGDVQPDWTNLSKFHIPYADEQQRLLANILTEFTKDKKPLPRFWYLPDNYKGAVLMAGDDHGGGNDRSQQRLNNWLNYSPTDCSATAWECVRASHYIYTNSALTNARALQFHNLGFEIGDHVSATGACTNATFAALSTIYTNDITAWRAKYTSLPNQRTHRLHCYSWGDWDSVPRVEINNGMRASLGYVVYPGSWYGNRAPVMTGSLMAMRLTDASGSLLDFYQGVTNLDDQSANSTAIAAILDNTANSSAYYGVVGTHYDMTTTSDMTFFTAAKSRNMPMISLDQLLTWLDGRNSSSFSGLSGSNGQYTFVLQAAEGATGLQAMLPIADAGGTLSSLKLSDNAVSYATQTIKGVQYAVFEAQPGSYTARYSDYTEPDAGGGGGSGNSGGVGTSSSSGGSHSATSGAAQGEATDEAGVAATDNIQGDGQHSAGQMLHPQELAETAAQTNNRMWLWVLLGALGLFAIAWVVILWRRRKHKGEWVEPTGTL